MSYPGQRVQIDVKYVPDDCIVGDAKAEGKKFYQYTAIDEYSRLRYLEAFEEHNTYTSAVFLQHMLKAFKFPVECVQTDNGTEFTKRLGNPKNPTPTLFEASLKQCGIRYKLIQPYTPRHNGKVERQHRIDEKRFYKKMKMYSLEDGRRKCYLSLTTEHFDYFSSYFNCSRTFLSFCGNGRSIFPAFFEDRESLIRQIEVYNQ